MFFIDVLEKVTEPILFAVCIFLLLGCIYITVKMRFVQIRLIPFLYRTLKKAVLEKAKEGAHTISPLKALFTTMSTTLGIATLVGPVIAIQIGGPGALLGFLLVPFFGTAATYVEVCLSVHHRKKLENGEVMGGPMQYLKHILSVRGAKWYAMCCMLLITGWSAAQANQLTAVLDSPSLGAFRVSPVYSGSVLVLLIMLALKGGVKKVGDLSAKIVPFMFVLYVTSSFWIIGNNFDKLGDIFRIIFKSALSPYSLATGGLIGGVVSTIRWGILKGVQTTEAGVGTQTIAHSMAETKDPRAQGAIAMVSTFTGGGLAFLSGCVALLTNTWQDPALPMGMGAVMASYEQYFSIWGIVIIGVSSLLFGFGTILGNSFNGLQCYGYLTDNRKKGYYLFVTAIMIFLGAVGSTRQVWSLIDILLVCLVVPHMTALLLSVRKTPELFLPEKATPANQ